MWASNLKKKVVAGSSVLMKSFAIASFQRPGHSPQGGSFMQGSKFRIQGLVVIRWLCVWFAIYGYASAIPGPAFEVVEISGDVNKAVWRSGFSVERLTVERDGNRSESSKKLPDQWLIVLRNVKGLSHDQMAWLRRFTENYPMEDIRKDLKEDEVLIVIPGGKDLPFRISARITLMEVSFASDEHGASMGYGSVLIGGKAFKSPCFVKDDAPGK